MTHDLSSRYLIGALLLGALACGAPKDRQALQSQRQAELDQLGVQRGMPEAWQGRTSKIARVFGPDSATPAPVSLVEMK